MTPMIITKGLVARVDEYDNLIVESEVDSPNPIKIAPRDFEQLLFFYADHCEEFSKNFFR